MNPIKIKWDLIIILLAVYNCISLPIELAMVPPFMQDNKVFDRANNLIDLFFLIDIIIQFRTTFVNPMTGDENHHLKSIAKNYLTGKFSIDVISTVPFDLLSKYMIKGLDEKHSKNFVLFSCMKLIRILRLTRIIDYMKSSDDLKL